MQRLLKPITMRDPREGSLQGSLLGSIGIFVLATVAISLMTAGAALACACCSDRGQRYEATERLGSDGMAASVVNEVKLAGNARLYSTEAGWEEASLGLNNPAKSEQYAVSLKKSATHWRFEFRDSAGYEGTVTMALPSTVEVFATDPRPGSDSPANGPTLYKEVRVTGVMTGTGMFALKTRGLVRAKVILHGHGNGCTFVDQFHDWTLDVNGPGARYRLFGRLVTAN